MTRYRRLNELVRQTFMPEVELPLFRLNKPAAAGTPKDGRSDSDRRIEALETQLGRLYKELTKRELI